MRHTTDPCRFCDGTGRFWDSDSDFGVFERDCPYCEGTGKYSNDLFDRVYYPPREDPMKAPPEEKR